MDNITFSIIVPVYKVEDYLHKCVDSILNQDYSSFEVILVDDGSPDKCPEICDYYAALDKRIHVIHKKNGGLSSARNVGVEFASGDYILFIDSDDYWKDLDALSVISQKISDLRNVDVITFNNVDYSCLSGKSVVCNRNYDVLFLESNPKDKVIKYLFNNNLFPGAAWVTITRRAFLIEHGIAFTEGIKAEDIDWLLNVFLNAESFTAINKAFYVYQKYRGGSITRTADIKSIKDILFIIDKWIQTINDKYVIYKKEAMEYLCKHYLCAVLIYDNIPNKQKPECKKMLRDFQFMVDFSSSMVIRIIGRLPIGVLSKLLSLYHNVNLF